MSTTKPLPIEWYFSQRIQNHLSDIRNISTFVLLLFNVLLYSSFLSLRYSISLEITPKTLDIQVLCQVSTNFKFKLRWSHWRCGIWKLQIALKMKEMLLGNSTTLQKNLSGTKFKTMKIKNSELETGQLGTRFFPRFVIKLQLRIRCYVIWIVHLVWFIS